MLEKISLLRNHDLGEIEDPLKKNSEDVYKCSCGVKNLRKEKMFEVIEVLKRELKEL